MATNSEAIQDGISQLQDAQGELVEAVHSPAGGRVGPQANTAFSAITDAGSSIESSSKRMWDRSKGSATALYPSLDLDFTRKLYLHGGYVGDTGITFEDAVEFARSSTATYFNGRGELMEAAVDEPRFEYDPLTSKPLGLKIEPPSENLVWPNAFSAQRNDRTELPDDYVRMLRGTPIYQITPTPGEQGGYAFDNGPYADPGEFFTLSTFLHHGDWDSVTIGWYGGSGRSVSDSTKAALSTDGTVNTSAYAARATPLGDGWFHLSVTVETDASGPLGVVWYFNGRNLEGEDKKFYVAGPQLERGKVATSYIPTTNAPASREVDQVELGIIPELDYGDFTIAAKGTQNAEVGSFFTVVGSGDTLRIGAPSNNGRTLNGIQLKMSEFYPSVSVGEEVVIGCSFFQTTGYVGLRMNDQFNYQPGSYGQVGTPRKIRLGTLGGSNNNISGHLKEFKLYPEALNEADLRSLT